MTVNRTRILLAEDDPVNQLITSHLLADLGFEVDLADNGVRAVLEPGERPLAIGRGPRVGLRQAADRPWRFWVSGDPTVSTYRPAAPRRGAAR